VTDLPSRVLVEPDAAPERVEYVLSMARLDPTDPDVELIRLLNKSREDPTAVARQLLEDADNAQAGT
jgi:hypothetical protein